MNWPPRAHASRARRFFLGWRGARSWDRHRRLDSPRLQVETATHSAEGAGTKCMGHGYLLQAQLPNGAIWLLIGWALSPFAEPWVPNGDRPPVEASFAEDVSFGAIRNSISRVNASFALGRPVCLMLTALGYSSLKLFRRQRHHYLFPGAVPLRPGPSRLDATWLSAFCAYCTRYKLLSVAGVTFACDSQGASCKRVTYLTPVG